jgi:pilus assembly protein Flp/PilA
MIRYMRNLMNARNDEGASAVEYGLLIAAIAAVIVIIVFALGGVIKNVFSKTCSTVSSGASVTGQTCSS